MRDLKADFTKFITGRVGMYYSFFIISPLLLVGMYILMAFGFGYLWAFFSIDPEEEVVIGLLHLFMLFLFPIIATAGVVGSVFRVVAAKGIPIIHKIMGVFFFLVVLATLDDLS